MPSTDYGDCWNYPTYLAAFRPKTDITFAVGDVFIASISLLSGGVTQVQYGFALSGSTSCFWLSPTQDFFGTSIPLTTFITADLAGVSIIAGDHYDVLVFIQGDSAVGFRVNYTIWYNQTLPVLLSPS